MSDPPAPPHRDPTLAAPPAPPPPKPPRERHPTSHQTPRDVLAHPLVQAVLRDAAVMRPVLAQDGRAVRNGALRAPSMEALLSDAGLVQRIAGLGG